MANAGLAPWGVEIAVIIVRDLADPKTRRLPLPSEVLATFVVFGALSVAAGNPTARRPALAVAWGLVVATFLSAKVDFLKPVGDFFAPSAGTTVGVQQAPSVLLPGASDQVPHIAQGSNSLVG